MNLIYDKKELQWFLDNIVPDLGLDEVYFVSLAVRNKYLDNNEREYYKIGRSEMFSRKIIKNKSHFISKIKQMNPNEGGYLTKNGKDMPIHAMICYFNINPSSSIKAYYMFNKVMNEYMRELSDVALNQRNAKNILSRINKQSTLLMNSYQKATGTKYWLDFDFDVPKDFLSYIEDITKHIDSHKGKAYIIETKSGYHLLVSKNTEFDKNFNPSTIVAKALNDLGLFLRNKVFSKTFEVIINKDAMIPLPGLKQGGFEVKIINKKE